MRGIKVTQFTDQSKGKRFRFIIKAITEYGSAESVISESMILADIPDKPSAAPSRSIMTSESIIAVNVVGVPGDHGSPIQSYSIESDDG